MGKEVSESARQGRYVQVQRKLQILKMKACEIDQQWSRQKRPLSSRELAEDGQVTVNIRSAGKDTILVWKGLPYEGNKFSQLSSVFKAKGLIEKKQRISQLSLYKDLMLYPVDPIKDCFQSGDNIIVQVEERKNLKKPKRKQKKKWA